MKKDDRILVAGARGLVGSALVRQLAGLGFRSLYTPGREELDLLDQHAVTEYFSTVQPDYVFLAAAKVGGILANNTYPADFIYQNLMIQNNIIGNCFKTRVKRMLFLGSSCIYPKLCEQPMKESYLMTGPLEPTNSPYATAKIAGIEMCWAFNRQHSTEFLPVMPTNLYGPNDNFDLETSHVLPALIRKFHEAKVSGKDEVVIWGTGTPMREFLHVDDLAEACVYLMSREYEAGFFTEKPLVNIGTGTDVTIGKLAGLIREIVGFEGDLVFDRSKPDGTPRKLLDVGRINQLGWAAGIGLEEGARRTYEWFLDVMQTRPK